MTVNTKNIKMFRAWKAVVAASQKGVPRINCPRCGEPLSSLQVLVTTAPRDQTRDKEYYSVAYFGEGDEWFDKHAIRKKGYHFTCPNCMVGLTTRKREATMILQGEIPPRLATKFAEMAFGDKVS